MISGVLLASYSFFGGGAFGDLLTQWEQMGFFSYILPFLLIFAVVFGVLSKTRIFEDNKAVNAIIALAVGFMSLQWDLVPRFFSEIFPRVGVGISIILIVIIFLGIFLPRQNWAIYAFLTVAAIVVIVILVTTTEAMGWQYDLINGMGWGQILVIVLVIAALGAMVGSNKEKTRPAFNDITPAFFSDMHRR